MTNVHTCMHICTYFCDLGPFGTHPPPLLYTRADPEQCCWGGARTVGGVRARRREAPSSKCDRGSAKRLPRELRQGSGGAKIGLLES